MRGLYRDWLTPRAKGFADAAATLAAILRAGCGSAQMARAREAWILTLGAWEGLATVPLGPLIERRAARALDFQPPRPPLIERAIALAPRGAEAMQHIGSPAKGLPALEWLLWTLPSSQSRADAALSAPACQYAAEVADDLLRESAALAVAVRTAADADWDEARGDAAFAELLNQWVGAVERLRWTQIDKPRREAVTRGLHPVPHPRAASGQTAASWQRQWRAIEALAVHSGDQLPQPGKHLVPLETYLRGRGLNPLADRWRAQVGRASGAMQGLQPGPAPRLDAAVRELAALKALAEAELAPAVQVSIGFSDADGD
jgi:predicted lipoprotein